ncbi:TolC family protein [Thermaurantiacus tibetensis]|uniref:TolC family protein n=1 Tax=Thermaurantiacus tibetensis TaxID=2759035 RepID=UPI00188FA775|nr:TolC family protein [Thermaurantiacus tibetensis]
MPGPLALFVLFAAAAPALADSPLPPAEAARAAIAEHPAVLAAEDRRDAAVAEGRARAAGPHAFQASASLVRRSLAQGDAVPEFGLEVSRAVRINGKARLDRAAADALVDAAGNRAEDARHLAARLLAGLWLDWVTAEAEARVLAGAEATLAKAQAGLERQVALRDAPALDAGRAAAARAAASAERLLAEGRARAARAALAARFPGLPLPADAPGLPLPEASRSELVALAGRIAEVSHELGALEAERRLAEAEAERARRDRLPDPSFGLRGFSEQGGTERGVGLLVSVPFGGPSRRAEAERRAALSSAAAAELASARRDVEAMAAAARLEAEAALAAAAASADASARAREVAARLARGHALGGVDLADRLLAERAALEAELAETRARAAAWRALTLLRIDAHALWLED